MKLRFVVKFGTHGRKNGDIEALADARRTLEKVSYVKSWKTLQKKEKEVEVGFC